MNQSGVVQRLIDLSLPYAYRGPMRSRPAEESIFVATALWVGVGDSFEQARGGRPYSESKFRYVLRIWVTISVLVGGIVFIRSLANSGEVNFLVGTTFFLFFMKGKILMLFEPLYIRATEP